MTMTTTHEAPTVDMIIGARVHHLLWRNRIRQVALAEALDISASVLSKKLRGESAWSAEQISAAASYLGVHPGDLFPDGDVGPARFELATYGLVVPNSAVAA